MEHSVYFFFYRTIVRCGGSANFYRCYRERRRIRKRGESCKRGDREERKEEEHEGLSADSALTERCAFPLSEGKELLCASGIFGPRSPQIKKAA